MGKSEDYIEKLAQSHAQRIVDNHDKLTQMDKFYLQIMIKTLNESRD